MSRKLFYIISICLLSFFQKASSQDCVLPESYPQNTGSNMTVFLTSSIIDALPVSSSNPYVVVLSSLETDLLIGRSSLETDSLDGGQQSIAVWGDDNGTPDKDGAGNEEEMIFQLVDGNVLYDLNFTFVGVNSYVTNGILPVMSVTFLENCSAPLPGCTDETACNYDANASNDDGSCTYAESYYDCNGDCI